MTITKKVLSLALALVMLLTMASFPAFADDPAYTPKTVEFVKTQCNSKINTHASNIVFTLPDVDYYVGDTIKFSDTFFTDNTFTWDTTEISGVWVDIKKYGTEESTTLYSYGDSADRTYQFQTAGTYVIVAKNYYTDNGTEPYTYYKWSNEHRFGVIEVKEPGTTAPTKPTTDKTEGGLITLTSANLEYMSKSTYTDATVKTASFLGSNIANIVGNTPAGTVLGFKFELDKEAYVKKITFTATNDNSFYMADIYGSLDGLNWYLLQDDQTISPNGTSSKWSATTFTAEVEGVAKYVKLCNLKWKGSGYTQNISGATVEGFAIDGSTAPTEIDITFVDKTVNSSNADEKVTITTGSTATVPTKYPTTEYKFYSNESCTIEIDITTQTFSAPTTIYVKCATWSFPTTDTDEAPKAVMLVRGSGNVAVLPAGVTVNVGDTLVFPVGHYFGKNESYGEDNTYRVSSWSNNALAVKRISSVDGSVDASYYSTNKGNLLSKGSSQNAGVFAITEPGVYTVTWKGNACSQDITVNTYAKGTYATSAPSPDKAYAAKTIELVYDDVVEMYTLPAGTVVRVGDTIKFSTGLKIRDYDETPKAIGVIQTLVSYDVNGNGKIDQEEVSAIDSKGSNEADKLLAAGEIKITNTGVYTFTTVGGLRTSTWLAPITVSEYAVDPSLVEGSNEIIYEDSSTFSSAVRVSTTEFILNLKAKVKVGTIPDFKYSIAPTSKNAVKVDEECTAEYDVYAITAKFDFPDDEIEVVVTYGDNFRVTANDTFYRYKSEDVFDTSPSILEGDNVFHVSNLAPVFNPTASSQPSVLFAIQVQQFVDGVNAGVINGVEYKDLAINLVDVVSKSSRFENFTLETFLYNDAKGEYQALLALTRGGIDQFVATLELTGINVATGKFEVIEEKVIKTALIETTLKKSDIDNSHRFGGDKVEDLLDQLKKVYADKNYVIIDTRYEYLVDEKGNFILDEQGNQIKNLAYKSNPVDSPNYSVDDVLWNGLINMNKSYFEFKYFTPTNDEYYGRGNIIKDIQCVEVSFRFDKANHNMMRLDENGFFRIGFRFNSITDNKNVKNAVKEQLGNGYDPLFFQTSWWTVNLPFTQTTMTLTLPEEWTITNGYEDYKLYRYTVLGNSNMAKFNQLILKQEGLAVKDRFKNELVLTLTSGNIYDRHALVGANGTVERPGDTTSKHNVATGGADLVATFATFAGIALAAYALRKRED